MASIALQESSSQLQPQALHEWSIDELNDLYDKRRSEGATDAELKQINQHVLDQFIEMGEMAYTDVGFPGQTSGGGYKSAEMRSLANRRTYLEDLKKNGHKLPKKDQRALSAEELADGFARIRDITPVELLEGKVDGRDLTPDERAKGSVMRVLTNPEKSFGKLLRGKMLTDGEIEAATEELREIERLKSLDPEARAAALREKTALVVDQTHEDVQKLQASTKSNHKIVMDKLSEIQLGTLQRPEGVTDGEWLKMLETDVKKRQAVIKPLRETIRAGSSNDMASKSAIEQEEFLKKHNLEQKLNWKKSELRALGKELQHANLRGGACEVASAAYNVKQATVEQLEIQFELKPSADLEAKLEVARNEAVHANATLTQTLETYRLDAEERSARAMAKKAELETQIAAAEEAKRKASVLEEELASLEPAAEPKKKVQKKNEEKKEKKEKKDKKSAAS